MCLALISSAIPKKSLELLDYLIRREQSQETGSFSRQELYSSEELSPLLDPREIDGSLDVLMEEGLIQQLLPLGGLSGNPALDADNDYVLTQQGRYFHEIRCRKFLGDLVVPAAVSLIVSLIVALIT